VLYDDRKEESIGVKFFDSDLIGIPFRIVLSEKTLSKNCVEIKKRDKDEKKMLKIENLLKFFQKELK